MPCRVVVERKSANCDAAFCAWEARLLAPVVGSTMRFRNTYYRYRARDVVFVAAVFFLCFSFIQVLITPMPSESSREHDLFKQQLSVIERETGLGDRLHEAKLLFQPEPVAVAPDAEADPAEMVRFQGALLPPEFTARLSEPRARFEFRIQPARVVGTNGLLSTRNFQGNTFAGTFMKGAIVFLVQSAVRRQQRRRLLRQTWASIREVDGWKLETVFIVGDATARNDQTDLMIESRTYDDILQYCGSDMPSEATEKTLAALQWSADTLPGDFIVAHTRDDAIVNCPLVRDAMAQQSPAVMPPGAVIVTRMRDGSTIVSSQPQRIYCFNDHDQRRRLTAPPAGGGHQRAGEWPPHCSEGLYAMPVTMARDLHQVARVARARLAPELGDVFVTGVLRRNLDRGDANVVVGGDGGVALRRYPRLSRTVPAARLSRNETAAEQAALRMWHDWRESLRSRFHVFTEFVSAGKR